jgi:glucose-6-phosphate-specific signal transduction histidine kinase
MLRWTPRVLAILMGSFLALFASDAAGWADLLTHLAPVAVVTLVVAVAWRYEWIGAIAFTVLATGYGFIARDHLSWVNLISGPLLAIAMLYALSAMKDTKPAG